MTEWTRKSTFCPNFQTSVEPICKHTDPKSRHTGLEGALAVSQTWLYSFFGEASICLSQVPSVLKCSVFSQSNDVFSIPVWWISLILPQIHYDDEDDSRNPFNISNDEYYYPKNLGENKLKANLAGSLQVNKEHSFLVHARNFVLNYQVVLWGKGYHNFVKCAVKNFRIICNNLFKKIFFSLFFSASVDVHMCATSIQVELLYNLSKLKPCKREKIIWWIHYTTVCTVLLCG